MSLAIQGMNWVLCLPPTISSHNSPRCGIHPALRPPCVYAAFRLGAGSHDLLALKGLRHLDERGVSFPADDGAVLFSGQAASEQAIQVSCFGANAARGQECPPFGSPSFWPGLRYQVARVSRYTRNLMPPAASKILAIIVRKDLRRAHLVCWGYPSFFCFGLKLLARLEVFCFYFPVLV